jgi:hypothetical protein
MQTNRRTLFSCRTVVFAVAIFVISTNTTTAAEIIPVSLIRAPLVTPSDRPLMVKCTANAIRVCEDRYEDCTGYTRPFDNSTMRSCLIERSKCYHACGG